MEGKSGMSMEENPFEGSFDSIEALAEAINDVLGCPVTIEDAHHRLIAYSSHDPNTDTARIATIVGRRVPDNVIDGLWRDGVIQRLAESNEPVRVKAIQAIGLNDRVAVAIRKNEELLGYIWVVEAGKQLGDGQLMQLKKAAQAAKAKFVQLQLQRRREEEGHQHFFWQLLLGNLQSEALIRQKAAGLGVALPDAYHIAVLQFASPVSGQTARRIRDRAEASPHLKPVFHVTDGSQFVLLVSPRFPGRTDRDCSAALASFFADMSRHFGSGLLQGGSGSLSSDYAWVERGYQEALTVLRIKARFPAETGHVQAYPDLGYYRYLPLMLEEKARRPFPSRPLEKLREYDREHNGDLLHTLEVFLGCDSNTKLAAEALHVHTNTLNYRLKRIAEIGDIDLGNMDQKVSLYLDLKTERLGR